MTDYDSTWKDALEAYFPDFMQMLFPRAFAGINWARGYAFCDKELQKLHPRGTKGPRTVDKLVEVRRTDGTEALVYVHVEVQSQPQRQFTRRMFIYHYRLFDKYGGDVVSLAVLADHRPGWRPCEFAYERWGCSLRFEFPIAKLMDFSQRWEALVKSDNTFAVVIQAHLKALETHGHPTDRKYWKLAILRTLYDRGKSREEIRQLFRFIDGLMTLPEAIDREFVKELETLEDEKAMPYVSSVERVYRERGLEEGRKEGRKEGRQEGELLMVRTNIIDALEVRFGDVPETVRQTIESVDSADACREIHRAAILADSMAEFERQLIDGEVRD